MTILYDQFGREIEVRKLPETREIAVTTIRDRWSNYPSGGLTPQSLATIFKEADQGDVARQAELFEEMEEKDTHLFSELQTRKNAVTGLDYDVAPFSESAEDKKIRDFVADCIFNLDSFEEALLDLLDAIGKGYSLAEILWRIDGGRAVIDRIAWIHAKKALFYERGAANMWQKSYEVPKILTEAQPIGGEAMPAFKLVYHRYKARSGYDTRAGLLRVCAWMYLFKNYGVKDWVAFAEVFGMPLRLGKYDSGASKEDKDALRAAIYSLGADAAGIISKNTEIEFVEAVKNAGKNNIYETLANFCDKQMSKAILGQTATTEGTPGKLGNEDAQDRVRHDLTKADCEALSNTIRRQIIRPLVGWNFGWDKPLPWFKILYERPEDLETLMTVYKGASEIGQPISQEHVSDRFKIPLPAEGETVIHPPAGGQPSGPGGGFASLAAKHDVDEFVYALKRKVAAGEYSESDVDNAIRLFVGLGDQDPGALRRLNTLTAKLRPLGGDRTGTRVVVAATGQIIPASEIDAADLIAEKLSAAAMPMTDAFLEVLRRLVEDPEVRDLEDLRARIIDLWGGLDPATLGALIARATAVAEMAGMADVHDETGG
jgi:phage gp29-like protein